MAELKYANEVHCWYCDQLNVVDHKHGTGASCGECCGIHGHILPDSPFDDEDRREVYEWIKGCLSTKNERIDGLIGEVAALQEKFDSMVRLNDANLESYNNCARKNATLKAQVERYRQHRDDYLVALEAAVDEGPEVVNRITTKVLAARAAAPDAERKAHNG
jgi:NAD(P)H-nitrite reductase large subunit